MKKQNILWLCLSLYSSSVPAAEWSLNDVSYLFPLGDSIRETLDQLPAPATEGEKGPLLPRNFYDRVGPLASFERPEFTFEKMRVVAVRIDPCFRAAGSESTCRPQIRMVWQPLIENANGLQTFDAGLHSFYELSATDFKRFATELLALRDREGQDLTGVPLGVHPVIARQGLKGKYFQGLKELILKYSGKISLTRLTFMKLSGAGIVWDFGGFSIENGALLPITIARVGKPRQRFVNQGFLQGVFTHGIMPAPATEVPNLNRVVQATEELRLPEERDTVIENILSAVKIENPREFSVEQIDCVSCHIAQPARVWAENRFPDFGIAERIKPLIYALSANSRHSLVNTTPNPGFTANLRAFGYFGREPTISQRVIHESIEVADLLNLQRE